MRSLDLQSLVLNQVDSISDHTVDLGSLDLLEREVVDFLPLVKLILFDAFMRLKVRHDGVVQNAAAGRRRKTR